MRNIDLSVITNINSNNKHNALTDLSNLELDTLNDLVSELAVNFCESLKKAVTVSDISGLFARIYYNPIILEAKKRSQRSLTSKKRLISTFQESASYLYEVAGSWEAATKKHYGYPGDFTVLESLYNGTPHINTSDAVGALLDNWAQDSELARAVIARKDTLRLILKDIANQHLEQNMKAKTLSIASGTAREIREIPREILNGIDLTLLDSDSRALDYTKGFFNSRVPAYDIQTLQANALDPSTFHELSSEEPFDLIYSFGLYDYLNDEQVLQSIAASKKILKDNGTFIFCLKDHRYYDNWFYELFLSWKFYDRIIDDGYAICEQAGLRLREQYVVEGRAVCIYVCDKQL